MRIHWSNTCLVYRGIRIMLCTYVIVEWCSVVSVFVCMCVWVCVCVGVGG